MAAKLQHKGGKSKTIRSKILSGYFLVIAVILVLVTGALFFLGLIENGYKDISLYRDQQYTAQSVITAHYKWLDQLNTTISSGVPFEGGLDPNSCSLGKWLNSTNPHDMNDQQMSDALQVIIEPHKEIHAGASEVIALSETDKEAATSMYMNEIKPKVEKIGEGLSVIAERYQAIAQEKSDHMTFLAGFSFVMYIVLGVLAVLFAVILGSRVSRKISAPITTVSGWSKTLADGVENLKIPENALQQANNLLEIEEMIDAFANMAESIRNNVNVIKRVANGDLTAFVDIRSDGDSLGANLYHLVQSNDFMFADLLRVADTVATNATNISQTSQLLAEKATEQAQAVVMLSETTDKANVLALKNADNANEAANISTEIKREIESGSDKMTTLVKAVEEIRVATDKISGVMKAIDDIAFQTNILALNAAVEAARAGTAGKGFSVVASEVRNLSLKSAEAAKQSGEFIQNTIQKAIEGSRISQDTFDMFETIVKSSNRITGVVEEIAGASGKQQQYIEEIHDEIRKISEVVASNAATSEETAAATEEMNSSASLIRQAMQKFNLRKRVPGKPYIPAEKEDDPEFIRQAHENYAKSVHAQRSGGF